MGDTVIGCGAPGLSLPDLLLPADALTLHVTVDGEVTVTPAAGLDALLEGEPIKDSTDWADGAYLHSGETVLQLVRPWEADADVTPSVDKLGTDFNRPPRMLPAPWTRAFTLLASVDRQVLVLAPRENALTAQVGATNCLVGVDLSPDDLVDRLRPLPPGMVVLIDDAEAYRESALAPVLLALVRQATDKEFGVLVAGQGDAMSGGFSGWLYEARRGRQGRQGIALSPSEALAGEVFGGRVARASLQARPLPGRAVLFDGSGDQVPLQVPKVG